MHNRFRVILDFTTPATAPGPMLEALEEALVDLPGEIDDIEVDIEVEERIVDVTDLPEYIGQIVTVNKKTPTEARGKLEQYYRTIQVETAVAVLNGYAVQVGTFDVAYINEGGTYEVAEKEETNEAQD